ncbi:lactosylceramide alpha-2,3-sialyltransferase isoform X2 [Austrofundulus limnaeus]|uniref:Lactosylceramide alpha-2,3-sialyltransferase n=1 Tax=Austrofundulus limnaeus TaxID=52670 RepID=A0A2I4CXH5_AUSLI|nr:PREDICTED: lactosylceramide alpha-2,3-sialyltransferase-like isoform X2 [Austrofundulus limnaeus]
MRFPLCWTGHRRGLAACLGLGLGLLSLVSISLQLIRTETREAVELHVSPAYKQLVHEYVRRVLEGPCRPRGTRQNLLAELPASSRNIWPFLRRDEPLSGDLFVYPPPFGFQGLKDKVEDLLQLLPDQDSEPLPERSSSKCHRCVVVGNGGILRGLELGRLINRFDTIIRLNSGPLQEFSVDVGNRTSVRMSYPEGTPLHWVDSDPHTVFVAVVYKRADLSWTSAMINRLSVNVPTLGVSALNLASLLCDEVSLVGFGYNLSQPGVPLHYYDHLPMSLMQQQKMHNVNQETEFLQRLVREGTITDLTGGVHCSFCSS